MGHHHDRLVPYGTAEQAVYGAKLAAAYLRNATVDGLPVDKACAVQGAHTAVGYALSFVPHDGFGTTPTVLEGSNEQLAVQVETLLVDEGRSAVPWTVLLPLLLKLLERVLR